MITGAHTIIYSTDAEADRALLRPLIDAKSAAYAREKGIKPRDCAKAS